MLAAIALTGCSKAPKRNAASPTSPSLSSSSSKPTSATPKPTPSPTGPASLGGRCDNLLPVTTIDDVLSRPVIGRTSFILGVAEPNIGRLSRINCQYGLSTPVKGKPKTGPLIEIGISLYNSATQASRRVQGTIEDYRTNGATQYKAAVATFPATILLGYTAPTLVTAAGPRTIVVTVSSRLVAGSPTSALVSLAKAALDATAGYTGAPGAGASSSPAASDSASPSSTSS